MHRFVERSPRDRGGHMGDTSDRDVWEEGCLGFFAETAVPMTHTHTHKQFKMVGVLVLIWRI